MASRKTVLMNPFAEQQWRCKHREQTDLWTQWGKEKEG